MAAGIALRDVFAALTGIIAGAVLCGTAPARAADFTVTPVQASLSSRHPSALLDLTNTGGKTLRFELSAYAWGQDASGRILLSPTDDLAFFPQLLDLAPGERRKLRIGTLSPAIDGEKSYRLFVEQLPAANGRHISNQVELLTRVGIPIFVRPAASRRNGEISALALARGRLSFAIRNTGNVHIVLESIQIVGVREGASPAFVKRVKGWYLLAGQTTEYQLDLSDAECRAAGAIEITARTEDDTIGQRLPLSDASCGSDSGVTAEVTRSGSGG